MSYENVHSIRDGRIKLYTRNDRPTYHARLKIEGHNGYIVRSTKRKSLAEAVRFAEDLYDDLRYKQRHGLEITPHTFASLWKRWWANHKNTLSVHRQRYLLGTANRYFLPFFGDMVTEQLSDVEIERYWAWRINYWSSDDGLIKIENAQKSRSTRKRPYKQKLGNVAKTPSQATLKMEQSALRQILQWANRLGIMNRLPEVKAPIIDRRKGIVRRPAFELDEWQKLYRYLRTWVNEEYDPSAKHPDGRVKRPHKLHRRQRDMIRAYLLFMGVSGLRPNEARQLRWRDVSKIVDANGVEQILLHISPTTKTGARDCIPLHSARRYLERIRAFSDHVDPDDFIFCDYRGNPIETFGKTFKKVLKDIDLLTDRFGSTRTVYSLRHMYATFRLLYGNMNIEDLAQNMGTSPTQIYNHYRHITIRQKAAELGGKLHPEKSRTGLFF